MPENADPMSALTDDERGDLFIQVRRYHGGKWEGVMHDHMKCRLYTLLDAPLRASLAPETPANLDYESEWYRKGWKAGHAEALRTIGDYRLAAPSLEGARHPDQAEPLRVMGAVAHRMNRDHEDNDGCIVCVAARPVLASLEGARHPEAGDTDARER